MDGNKQNELESLEWTGMGQSVGWAFFSIHPDNLIYGHRVSQNGVFQDSIWVEDKIHIQWASNELSENSCQKKI